MLIVDDEKNIRLTLAQALEPLGLAVDTAAGGKEALGRLHRQRYRLMFLDLRMPDTDGMDVLEKACEIQPELPVIVSTAHGTPKTAAETIKRGAADFVQKGRPAEGSRCRMREGVTPEPIHKQALIARGPGTEHKTFVEAVADRLSSRS